MSLLQLQAGSTTGALAATMPRHPETEPDEPHPLSSQDDPKDDTSPDGMFFDVRRSDVKMAGMAAAGAATANRAGTQQRSDNPAITAFLSSSTAAATPLGAAPAKLGGRKPAYPPLLVGRTAKLMPLAQFAACFFVLNLLLSRERCHLTAFQVSEYFSPMPELGDPNNFAAAG